MNPNTDTTADTSTVAQPVGVDDPMFPPWMAASRVGLSPSTLAKMRMDGRGPRFVKLSANRVGYRLSALNAWLEARERSTTLESKAAPVSQ